jgi:hypothetical protein
MVWIDGLADVEHLGQSDHLENLVDALADVVEDELHAFLLEFDVEGNKPAQRSRRQEQHPGEVQWQFVQARLSGTTLAIANLSIFTMSKTCARITTFASFPEVLAPMGDAKQYRTVGSGVSAFFA